MHDIITLVVSTIEFLSIFSFILVAFRFPLGSYKYHLLFASIFISQFSFLIRNYEVIDSIAPLLLAVTVVLFICFLFRVRIFYATAMGITGYAVYIIIQLAITSIINVTIPLDEILSNFLFIKLLQIASIVSIVLLTYLLARKNIGFSFVPDSEREEIRWTKQTLMFAVFLVITLISISIIHYLVISGSSLGLYVSLLSIFILVSILLYFSFRKEVGK